MRACREADRPPTPSYKPMAYNTLRTTCLDAAKQRIQKALQQWDKRAKTTGMTICTDGWSDAQNRPILNALAVCPKGAMFLDAVDTSGKVKSAEYIAEVLTSYIEAVGADRVVQVRADLLLSDAGNTLMSPPCRVGSWYPFTLAQSSSKCSTITPNSTQHYTGISYFGPCLFTAACWCMPSAVLPCQVCTDNAANCKAAGRLIEEAYPHITWSPCAAHVCDLALEDIFKLDYFREVYDNTKAFVTFINNHQATLAAWRRLAGPDQAIDLSSDQASAPVSSTNLSLLKPGDTRFASAYLMLERTLKVKAKLQQFVVSDGWIAATGAMKRADQVGIQANWQPWSSWLFATGTDSLASQCSRQSATCSAKSLTAGKVGC